jgi:hypothetical protein
MGILFVDFLRPGGNEIYIATTDPIETILEPGYVDISYFDNLSVDPTTLNVVFVQYQSGVMRMFNPIIDTQSGNVTLNDLGT